MERPATADLPVRGDLEKKKLSKQLKAEAEAVKRTAEQPDRSRRSVGTRQRQARQRPARLSSG